MRYRINKKFIICIIKIKHKGKLILPNKNFHLAEELADDCFERISEVSGKEGVDEGIDG
jgi:hypothetical protein